MNITEISIKRPSLIIVLFSVFALLGIIGYKNLSYELMPDFNQPVVVIKQFIQEQNPMKWKLPFPEKLKMHFLIWRV
jgi:HAE1 family hydrophobic/amphiphilic exporter-1